MTGLENSREGFTIQTKYGEAKCIRYANARNIDVQFQDEYKYVKRNAKWGNFIRGNVRNPYFRTMFGVGYLGEGNHAVSIDGTHTKEYTVWKSMFSRCYSDKNIVNSKSYTDCFVCREWHNFQNFAKWFDENYYEIDGEHVELDKDILYKNNKKYSPNYCRFVPKSINSLLTKRDLKRGDLPIGVSYHKVNCKYISSCHINAKQCYLGSFNTIKDAFETYKREKEKEIKRLANLYRERLPKEIYEALIAYKVEITD